VAFKKAIKEQVKLRLAIDGLAGTGKTFSSLSIASALAKLIRARGDGEGRIAVIDSERGSASLYADKFDFDVDELESFSPLAYVERIKEAERLGYDIIIGDSISHAWSGKDGALEQKDEIAARSSSGNTWTAWRSVTPRHNALVDAMLQCKAHFIATMRQKMEFAQQSNGNKTEIVKLGLAAIQREGMEYEFTLVGDMDHTHTLKISKSRIDTVALGEQVEKPGEAFARRLYEWLMSGSMPVARIAPTPASGPDDRFAAFLAAMETAADLPSLDGAASGPAKPAKGTPEHIVATETYHRCKAALQQSEAKAS
jgi:hypothetical protein